MILASQLQVNYKLIVNANYYTRIPNVRISTYLHYLLCKPSGIAS